MRGCFRIKSVTDKFWEYYFIGSQLLSEPMERWGVIQLSLFEKPKIIREAPETFYGESELLLMNGLKFVCSHLNKGRIVQEVFFDN